MALDALAPRVDEFARVGSLTISASVAYTWLIIGLFGALVWVLRGRIVVQPGRGQILVEGLVEAAEHAVKELLPDDYRRVTPFILSLWAFLAVANLLSLIPGLRSPTADLSVTSALAVVVYLSVHWFGIRSQGWKAYLAHYLSPSPFLLPLHLLSEITRTAALAIRLFGNIMSMDMIAMLLLMIAGFLVPVPILMLHVVEGLIQAYIFGTLALIYIASGIQSQRAAAGAGEAST